MPKPTDEQILNYIAHCASCGAKIDWGKDPFHHGDMMVMDGQCSSSDCGNKWSFTVDIDPSGTFGVMGFQCNNEDRVL